MYERDKGEDKMKEEEKEAKYYCIMCDTYNFNPLDFTCKNCGYRELE